MRSANEILTDTLQLLEAKKNGSYTERALIEEIRIFLTPECQEIRLLAQFISNDDVEAVYYAIKAADPRQSIYSLELPEDCEDDSIMIYEPFKDSITTVQDLLNRLN